ncbi:MAG TPA: hypothetical protein VGC12_00290 [Methyloradius sp.]
MLEELEGLTILDENETEKLYKLQNDLFDTVVLVCNGEEFGLEDWQSNDTPKTLEDAADYNWLPLAEIFAWHD